MWGGVATAAALCPLACWDLLARTHVIGMILAAVLAVGAGFGLALAFGLLRPGARGGLLLAYVPVTTVVVCVGVLLERRQLTFQPGELISWRRAGGWLLLAVFTVGLGVVVTPLAVLTSVFHSGHVHVLPLPPDLVVEQDDRGCGSDTCTRDLTITSPSHAAASQVTAELRRFLTTARGWTLDVHGSGCRPSGWLNANQTCLKIEPDGQHVHLRIDETGPWV